MKILLVEDDLVQADVVAKALDCGHEISRVRSGEDAVRFLRSNVVHLVVLDWQLPRMSGFDVLQWIRNNLGDEPAVLFLTCRVLEVDIVRALEAGADEYVVKPVRLQELTARVNALARRIARNQNEKRLISIGDYVLNAAERCVSLRDENINLTGKEFTLVAYFFDNIGKVISRDSLATLAWGRGLDSTSRTIDTHVYRLRQKLSLRPENGVRLSTIYTHGYRLDEVNLSIEKTDSIPRLKSGTLTFGATPGTLEDLGSSHTALST